MHRHLITAATLALLTACSADTPGTGDRATLLDVAQAAARGSDRVSVEDLATWLVQDRADFVLIDVRSAAEYAVDAIGEARNLSVAELLSENVMKSLPRDRKLVLYSNGAETSAKAATLLRVAGFDAQVLSGGYNAWHARILNPDIPVAELDGETLQVSEQRALACYFVGDRGAGAATRPDVEFVPPVFDSDETLQSKPLPPVTKESC